VWFRLRQCCCHVSLLTKGLKKEESDSDNLALEVAMGALTLEEELTDKCQMVGQPLDLMVVCRDV